MLGPPFTNFDSKIGPEFPREAVPVAAPTPQVPSYVNFPQREVVDDFKLIGKSP